MNCPICTQVIMTFGPHVFSFQVDSIDKVMTAFEEWWTEASDYRFGAPSMTVGPDGWSARIRRDAFTATGDLPEELHRFVT